MGSTESCSSSIRVSSSSGRKLSVSSSWDRKLSSMPPRSFCVSSNKDKGVAPMKPWTVNYKTIERCVPVFPPTIKIQVFASMIKLRKIYNLIYQQTN